ncbi:hypothetical protein [Streptomyces sp. NPDC000618]|uniref:hypothetical protein n=1 Tax=Streptomyces sp. NPDC000618 TaxID=3154265 RepID=UPI00332A9010
MSPTSGPITSHVRRFPKRRLVRSDRAPRSGEAIAAAKAPTDSTVLNVETRRPSPTTSRTRSAMLTVGGDITAM